MPHSYTQLYYHVVFSTNGRHPWTTGEIENELHPFIAGGVRDQGGHMIVINGIEDHIHILARLRQDKAIADVLRDLKADSSGWIHKRFPQIRSFAWQKGYAAFTVSASRVPSVEAYIRNQKEHHKKMNLKEELLALLIAHGVEFDEKYLWD